MQRSQSEVIDRFALPSGVATNSHEIKNLQRKLLQNHYQQQEDSLRNSRSTRLIMNQNDESEKNRRIQQYDSHSRIADKQLKNSLSNDLAQQIRIKNQMQQISKQHVLRQQHELIKNVSQLQALEKEQQKQFNRKYALEAQEDRKLKLNNRQQEFTRDQQQKQYYRNRYNSSGELTQSLARNNSYTNPTKQYYYEVDRALKNREPQVVNPEQFHNSSFKITRRADSLSSLDFMFKGSQHQQTHVQHTNIFQEMKQKEMREKLDLKNSLLRQIQERQITRKTDKMNDFNTPYTNREFLARHHPINNPVDYRIAHDNRYVMKELGSLQ